MTTARACLLALIALACTYDNPERCNFKRPRPGDCRKGLVCAESNVCVALGPDAAATPLGQDASTLSRDVAQPSTAMDAGPSGASTDAGVADVNGAASGDAPAAAETGPSTPQDARDGLGDQRGSCADDRDCPLSASLCIGGVCVRCSNDGDCDQRPGRRCDPASGRCVACVTSPHCPWQTPICGGGRCQPCTTPGTAPNACALRDPSTPMCKPDGPNGICVGCTSAIADCTRPELPICDGQPSVCRACASHGECAARSNATPYCAPTRGCFACLLDAHCPDPARPICSPTNTCVPCTKDEQCATKHGPNPGLCLDGRCASDGEAVYVDNRAGCTDSGSGTAITPYCQPQPAVDAALGAGKRLVVLRGSAAFQGFAASVSGAPLSVIGTGTSTLRGGTTAVVHVRSGEVHLRGVRMREGTGVGVLVEAAGSLRLNRAELSYNTGGGLQVNGGGYNVTNTVVSWNGNQSSCDPTGWGVYLAAGAGKPARFVNNTLLGNCGYGLRCGGPVVAPGVLAFNNTGMNLDPTCGVAPCCTGDPMLSGDRLTANSRQCIDVLDAAQGAPDDIIGAARPIGARSDCGAHEYTP